MPPGSWYVRNMSYNPKRKGASLSTDPNVDGLRKKPTVPSVTGYFMPRRSKVVLGSHTGALPCTSAHQSHQKTKSRQPVTPLPKRRSGKRWFASADRGQTAPPDGARDSGSSISKASTAPYGRLLIHSTYLFVKQHFTTFFMHILEVERGPAATTLR